MTGQTTWRTRNWRARAEAAEARVEELESALRPFADYHNWRTTKGQKVKPPAYGPKELQAAADVLAASSPPPADKDSE